MKAIDLIKRGGRSLKNAKARTILTSLAIAVGAFTLTLSLAAGEGARQYAEKLIKSNVDPQSVFVAKDPSIFGEGGAPGGGGLKEYSVDATVYGGVSFKSLTQADIDAIKSTPNVVSVLPTYIVNAQKTDPSRFKLKQPTNVSTTHTERFHQSNFARPFEYADILRVDYSKNAGD